MNNRFYRTVFSLIFGLSFTGLSFTSHSQTNSKPSFNCAGNLSPIEQSICENERLANLDVRLSGLYKTARNIGNEAQQIEIKASQRIWLKTRNSSCGELTDDNQRMVDCIELHYLRRIVELQDKSLNVSQKVQEPVSVKETTPLDHIVKQETKTNTYSPETLIKNLFREGYAPPEIRFDTNTANAPKGAQQALESALACAKTLNKSSRVKRKQCLNFTQDIAPIGIEFSDTDKLCASVDVQGQGIPKLLITSDSVLGSVKYENGTVIISTPTRRSSREFYYNFNRDKGHTIIDDIVRTDFTDCGDE